MRALGTIILALLLASCSELPKQGFMTRYLGGSIGTRMRSAVVPVTDFADRPIGQPYHSEFEPAPPAAPAARPVHGIDRMNCDDVARKRAQDVLDEGYDRDVQQHVFDNALADCKQWQSRN